MSSTKPQEKSQEKPVKTPFEDFRQLAYYWIKQIPYGQVASYGQIAKMAGFPRHARHVSKALGAAEKSLKLPWHRVIAASGKIAFDPDSDGFARQKKLLEDEGVSFKKDKIDLKQFQWQPVSSVSESQKSDISAEDFFK